MPCRASSIVVANESELLAHLRKRLRYEPSEGALYRKAGFAGVEEGDRIGSPTSQGKRQAAFLGTRYQVDRLVWLWETGSLPSDALLHLDGDNANDRFENLKEGRRGPSLGDRRAQFLSQVAARFGTAVACSGMDYAGHDKPASFACSSHGPFKRKPGRLLASSHGCPACSRERGQDMVRKTPAQKLERQRAYQQAHPGIYAGANRKSRTRIKESDPKRWDDILKADGARKRSWNKTDNGRRHGRLQRQRRRARERDALTLGLTSEQWASICAAHTDEAGRVCCRYCKQPCSPTIDHVVPIVRGGRHEPSNVVPACGRCNSSKADHLVSEWPRAAVLLDINDLAQLSKHTHSHLHHATMRND